MTERDEIYKRHRDRMARDYLPEKIPPEKRGMVTCPECKGRGGIYTKEPDKLAVFHGCERCKLKGEITPDQAKEPWPPKDPA